MDGEQPLRREIDSFSVAPRIAFVMLATRSLLMGLPKKKVMPAWKSFRMVPTSSISVCMTIGTLELLGEARTDFKTVRRRHIHIKKNPRIFPYSAAWLPVRCPPSDGPAARPGRKLGSDRRLHGESLPNGGAAIVSLEFRFDPERADRHDASRRTLPCSQRCA